jgi:hypothetical protein
MFGKKRALELGDLRPVPEIPKRNDKGYARLGELLAQIPPFMRWWIYETDMKEAENRFRISVEYRKDGFENKAGEYGRTPEEAVEKLLAVIAKGNHKA